jgi:hypothetical protein
MQVRHLEKAAQTKPLIPSPRMEMSSPVQVSRSGPYLLQLQKQFGNRYVQRAVARARQSVAETEAPHEIGEAIQRQQGLGQPLDRNVRAQMEPAFGTSFQHVRVHTGPEADQLNRSVSARAFTTGRDIFFRTGEYSPGSYKGRELLAHELTHVVQQTGRVQPKLMISQPGDPYEQEADRVAQAVMRAQPMPQNQRASTTLTTVRPSLQRGILGDIADFASDTVSSAAEAVGDFVGNIIDRAVGYIKDHARSIPGYDLVAVILGRDPITQDPVERNATNLLRGLLGLLPGGAAIFENLQRSGVIERAFNWVSGELTRLNLTWPVIRGAIQRFLNSLSARDILHLGDVLDRARAIFGPIVTSVITFARSAVSRILEFIFEGAIALGGSAAQRILAIFRQIGATFSLIVTDPVRFLQNLINSVAGGFQQFGRNILSHLRVAVFEWLFGVLSGTGLQLPRRFDFQGILSIVLQVLGLTYARVRERLVRVIGERPVQVLEGTFEFLRILVTQGIAAAWEKILEFAGNLTDMVVDGIKNWIRNTIVTQAIQQIASLFTPVGAIIQAIIKIYNTVMFVIERARQLAEFVGSVIASIDSIARGNISAAIGYIERTLARTISLVISFLARFIGLGGIGDRIREIIQRIHGVVDRAIDRVVGWITTAARRLIQGDRGPVSQTDSPRATAVKADALQEVRNRLATSNQSSITSLHELLRVVHAQFRPRGLLSLAAVVDNQGRVAISARASDPAGITLRWNEVFRTPSPSLRPLYERVLNSLTGEGYGSETYAAISVNGSLRAAQTNARRHAESMLIDSGDLTRAAEFAQQSAQARGGRSELILVINRSPCKSSCTTRLRNWISTNRSRYPNVRFILAPTGAYSPTITRAQMIEQIIRYLDETRPELIEGLTYEEINSRFTYEQLRSVYERHFGRLIQTSGVNEEEATDETDLANLGRAGWELRQFQVRARPTAAELRLADLVRRVREELGQTFNSQEHAE